MALPDLSTSYYPPGHPIMHIIYKGLDLTAVEIFLLLFLGNPWKGCLCFDLLTGCSASIIKTD
jgi:hypothetical protein